GIVVEWWQRRGHKNGRRASSELAHTRPSRAGSVRWQEQWRGANTMDEVPVQSPTTPVPPTEDAFPLSGGAPHSLARGPWLRAALTVALVITALSVLVAHEAPTLLPTVRANLFSPPTPVPTATAVLTIPLADVLRARAFRL